VRAKRGSAVGLKFVAAQVQAMQRQECREVGAKSGSAVSLKAVAAYSLRLLVRPTFIRRSHKSGR
jgi:hypothetical protein